MNRTLVGKPFGINDTEISYEDPELELSRSGSNFSFPPSVSFVFVSWVSLLFHLDSDFTSYNTGHLLHIRFCRFRKIGKSGS